MKRKRPKAEPIFPNETSFVSQVNVGASQFRVAPKGNPDIGRLGAQARQTYSDAVREKLALLDSNVAGVIRDYFEGFGNKTILAFLNEFWGELTATDDISFVVMLIKEFITDEAISGELSENEIRSAKNILQKELGDWFEVKEK